jgi:myo-inositol-1(or 4)-monophosphatase
MVAMGAADLMHEFSIHVWDIAAGDLIVREAGGVCIDPAGKDLLCPLRILADSFNYLINWPTRS